MFKELIKSSLVGLLAKVISGVGSFLIIPLMLRQLGIQNFGIWMTISSSVGLASFLDLGISNNLMNRLAFLNVNGGTKEINRTISMAYLIQFFVTCVIILFLSAIFKFVDWNYVLNIESEFNSSVIYYTFLFFFLNLFSNTIYSVQRGLQYVRLANIWILINSICYLGGIYALLFYNPDLTWLAILTFGIPFLISGINTFHFFYIKEIKLNFAFSNFSKQSILEFSGRGFVFLYLQIVALIAFQSDNLILAHITDYARVSEYNVALKLYSIPTVILGIYFQSLWPRYADYSARDDWSSIQKTFYKSLWLSFSIVMPFVLGVVVFQEEIMKYWLKDQATISIELLIAFSSWTIINGVLATNLGIIFNGLNILKLQVKLSLGMLICNLILSIFLAKSIGVSGVVWGSAISSLLFSCIPLIIYIRKIFREKC